MGENHAEVMRLLSLAQTGHREQALRLADERLRVEESSGMLYARAVALHSIGDHDGSAQTAEAILARTAEAGGVESGSNVGGGPAATFVTSAAEPSADADPAGWRSIALPYRAWQRLLRRDDGRDALDLESILQDLAEAEDILSGRISDNFVLATAHTCLGNAYHEIRLYELAVPNFEAAFAAATRAPREVVTDRAVASQLNLSTLHLNWSVELHRIGDDVGADEKRSIAAVHAALSKELAITHDTRAYAAHANLLLACAGTSHDNAAQAVERIRGALRVLEGRGLRESPAYALPFLARALDRAGRRDEALAVAQQAITALPEDATWMVASAAHHTRAELLAESGSAEVRAALAYGDQLAETMWRQRLRTLHDVTSRRTVRRVTLERDRVQVLANTDALTGLGNRRAFDLRLAELAQSATDSLEVALVVVDVDRLKAVNDRFGHETGDRTLRAVAAALRSQIRSGDLVARLGGDEFVAVLDDLDLAAAADVADRMVEAVSTDLGARVTISVGVAAGRASEAGAALLRAADRAMYEAKRRPKARVGDPDLSIGGQSRTG